VTSAIDALIDGGVVIRRELVLEIGHCLMSAANGLTQIERVYSHPQALAQCREWLGKHLPAAQLVQTPSTSAAAREALSDAAGAAIGSKLAAELFGVAILRENIQDRVENATRFVMLANDDAPRTGNDKTTLAFAVHDSRGALRRVLEIFDDAGVNLTRIESRPSRRRVWDYVFLADLEGHREDPHIVAALATLNDRCPMLKILGSYPRSDLSPT
jgi:chorismate mutase/prephenate dehydratase